MGKQDITKPLITEAVASWKLNYWTAMFNEMLKRRATEIRLCNILYKYGSLDILAWFFVKNL